RTPERPSLLNRQERRTSWPQRAVERPVRCSAFRDPTNSTKRWRLHLPTCCVSTVSLPQQKRQTPCQCRNSFLSIRRTRRWRVFVTSANHLPARFRLLFAGSTRRNSTLAFCSPFLEQRAPCRLLMRSAPWFLADLSALR